jgi:hypothetical protein
LRVYTGLRSAGAGNEDQRKKADERASATHLIMSMGTLTSMVLGVRHMRSLQA